MTNRGGALPRICRYLLPIFFMYFLFIVQSRAQCVSITGISTTESRCLNSGTAEIATVGDLEPYTYRVTSGPPGFVLPPPQSNAFFGSLPPGNYQATVTDRNNCTANQTFIISGNYQNTNPTASATAPSCEGGANGAITIAANGNRPPYTYELTAPISRPPQGSNIFSGLAAGSYTYRVYDSCGNYQTRTISVPQGSSNVFSTSACVTHIGCDRFSVRIQMGPAWGTVHKYPYTVRIFTPASGLSTFILNNASEEAELIVEGESTSFDYEVENACGYTQNVGSRTIASYIDFYNTLSTAPGICGGAYNYIYINKSNGTIPSAYASAACSGIPDSLHYYLLNNAGDTIRNIANDPLFTGLTAGNTYKVIAQGLCFYREQTFTAASPPSPSLTASFMGPSCKVGGAIVLIATGNKQSATKLIVTSGPPEIVFRDTTIALSYPDTLFQDFGWGYIGHWGVGTYNLKIVDACNNEATTSFTVNASQVRQAANFTATPVPGCIDNSKIAYQYTNPGGNISLRLSPTVPASGFPAIGVNLSGASGRDTIKVLPARTYSLFLNYSDGATFTYLSKFTGIACDVDTLTLNVTTATTPLFDYPALAVCPGNLRNISIIVDSAHGVAPYTFEMRPTGAPTYSAPQLSPVYTGLTAGMYDVRIGDACANSFTKSIFIDTLSVPGIQSFGNTFCTGDNIELVVPVNQYYDYVWTRPDGSIFAGDTLRLPTTAPSDFGLYRVKVISEVASCIDSSIRFFTLIECMPLDIKLLSFTTQRTASGKVQVNWVVSNHNENLTYQLLHSTNGTNWKEIYSLADNINNESQSDYQYLHDRAESAINMYKLKISIAGKKAFYSPVRTVAAGSQDIAVHVFPNPVQESVTISVTGNTGIQNAYIYNAQGAEVRRINISGNVTVENISGLPAGIYTIKITGDTESYIRQIVKL